MALGIRGQSFMVVALTLLGVTTAGTAQDQRTLRPGDRVNVRGHACTELSRPGFRPCPPGTEPRRYNLVGTLVAATIDSIVVEGRADTATLVQPLGTITGLELYRGRTSAVARGAAIGFAVAAAVGVVAVLSNPPSDDAPRRTQSCDPAVWGNLCSLPSISLSGEAKALLAVIAAGAAGAVAGALIGRNVGRDRWERVLIAVLPDGRLGVTARTRF